MNTSQPTKNIIEVDQSETKNSVSVQKLMNIEEPLDQVNSETFFSSQQQSIEQDLGGTLVLNPYSQAQFVTSKGKKANEISTSKVRATTGRGSKTRQLGRDASSSTARDGNTARTGI